MRYSLRVLQIVPHYPPAHRFGGVPQVAHALSRALISAGHDVRVCTTNLVDRTKYLPASGESGEELDGVTVFRDAVPFLRYWGFSPAMYRRLVCEVPSADVVLIHFHYQFASVVGGWLASRFGRPYVVFTHGSLHDKALARRRGWLKRAYVAALERQNFRQALFVACQSDEERAHSRIPGSVRVIPNGVTLDTAALPSRGTFRRARGLEEADPLFLFLGRLDSGKGLDVLVPAFRRLADRRSSARLVIAGADERGYRAQLQRLVDAEALSEAVVMTGLLDEAEKRAALADADAFVLPSRHEGMSVAMLEAMAAGVPMVVTESVGLASKLRSQQCARVVPCTVDALASALADVVENKRASQDMAQRARSLVEARYSWDTIARGLLDEVSGA